MSMSTVIIPVLTEAEKREGLSLAAASPRRRHPKILHQQGAEFNEVFNFMMNDSYMQPHLHPGPEKIEHIYVVEGKLAVLYFNDQGEVINVTVLEKGGTEMVAVPAFTWHTYVMLTPEVITYETMMGKYDPQTWKDFFSIAPAENTPEGVEYLSAIRKTALEMTASA